MYVIYYCMMYVITNAYMSCILICHVHVCVYITTCTTYHFAFAFSPNCTLLAIPCLACSLFSTILLLSVPPPTPPHAHPPPHCTTTATTTFLCIPLFPIALSYHPLSSTCPLSHHPPLCFHLSFVLLLVIHFPFFLFVVLFLCLFCSSYMYFERFRTFGQVVVQLISH